MFKLRSQSAGWSHATAGEPLQSPFVPQPGAQALARKRCRAPDDFGDASHVLKSKREESGAGSLQHVRSFAGREGKQGSLALRTLRPSAPRAAAWG